MSQADFNVYDPMDKYDMICVCERMAEDMKRSWPCPKHDGWLDEHTSNQVLINAERAEDRCRQDGEDEEPENVHPLFQDILKPFLRGRKQ